MQVILKKDIEKLGYADDIVDVRPGYANNFLIPQGYAISATESAKKVLAARSQTRRSNADHHRQGRGRPHLRFGDRSQLGRGS